MKGSGKTDDRKGHVRFEAGGAGDGFTVELVRHRQTKETVTDRLHLIDIAPVLNPTHFENKSPPDLRFKGLISKVVGTFSFCLTDS